MVVKLPGHGLVTFEADGATWSLRFGINALCDLEAQVADEEEVQRLLTGEGAAFQTIRAGFWAALRERHPDLTLEDAGRLIEHLTMVRAGSLMAQALLVAFPEIKRDARPRKAARRKA